MSWNENLLEGFGSRLQSKRWTKAFENILEIELINSFFKAWFISISLKKYNYFESRPLAACSRLIPNVNTELFYRFSLLFWVLNFRAITYFEVNLILLESTEYDDILPFKNNGNMLCACSWARCLPSRALVPFRLWIGYVWVLFRGKLQTLIKWHRQWPFFQQYPKEDTLLKYYLVF